MGDRGPEGLGGQRPVEHQGRGESGRPQGTDEGRRLPGPVGDMAHAPLAPGGPAPLPRQLGGKPTLIQKHQARASPGRLALPPVLPGGDDIRAGLFLRDQDFFFSSGATAATPATPP